MTGLNLHNKVATVGWKLANGEPTEFSPEEWFDLYKEAMADEELHKAKRGLFREHARKIRELHPDLAVDDSDVENE